MLNKKSLLAIGVVFLLFFSMNALAQDTVIMASTQNYPDALVASSAAAKIGSPVLLTERDELPEDMAETISEYAPKEIVIVGGPAVISEQVQAKLQEKYEVTRLWGLTRYGTANQVANHFWPEGADEAFMIQNRMQEMNSDMLAQAKELARQKKAPIFLTPDGDIPAETMAQMQSLGVKKTTAIGPDAAQIRSQLQNMGLRTRAMAGNTEQIKERVRQQVMENASDKDWLVVVAAGFYNHSIAAANPAQSRSLIVSNEDEIPDIVSLIKERNISKVKVAGRPLLAEKIASALENDTDAQVELVVSQAAQAIRMNRNLSSGNNSMQRYHNWSRNQMKHWNQSMDQIRQRVNATIQKAREMVENGTEKAQRFFNKAQGKCEDEKWLQCYQDLQKSMSEQRMNQYQRMAQDEEKVHHAMNKEMQNLSERVQNLTRMNQEFGQIMRQEMNVTERLQVIEQFKNRRAQKVQKVMQAAMQMHNNESMHGKSMGEIMRDADKPGKPDAPGNSNSSSKKKPDTSASDKKNPVASNKSKSP